MSLLFLLHSSPSPSPIPSLACIPLFSWLLAICGEWRRRGGYKSGLTCSVSYDHSHSLPRVPPCLRSAPLSSFPLPCYPSLGCRQLVVGGGHAVGGQVGVRQQQLGAVQRGGRGEGHSKGGRAIVVPQGEGWTGNCYCCWCMNGCHD